MSVEDYIEQVAADRLNAVQELRNLIKKNLPQGFEEVMQYGMISYVVPHSIYPAGYHCKPAEPLPFMGLASQKGHIGLYHMGLYADDQLLQWFQTAYEQAGVGKLDMGKSCIRFKKIEKIPFPLIGELCTKMSVQDWISLYEGKFKKKS